MDRMLVASAATDAGPGRAGAAEWFLRAVSAVIIGAWLTVVGFGGWVVFAHLNDNGLVFLGLLVLGLAYLTRPRLGRMKKVIGDATVVTRERNPQLRALIDDVAAKTSAPVPDVVILAPAYNAATTVVGLQRKRLLVIGLPLWAALGHQERVALLGHELAHFRYGDSMRGHAIHPATSFFGNTAGTLRRIGDGAFYRGPMMGLALLGLAAKIIAAVLLYVHVALNMLRFKSSHRTELDADRMSVFAGGTAAAVGLIMKLAGAAVAAPVINGSADPGQAMDQWNRWVQSVCEREADRMDRLRQLSRRIESSLFATHPASYYRHKFVAQLPYQDPAVVLTEARSAQIDVELGPYAEDLRRRLKEARDGF